MREDIINYYLKFKEQIIYDYSIYFVEMLFNDKKITADNKKAILKSLPYIIKTYINKYYFSNAETYEIIDKLVNNDIIYLSLITTLGIKYDKFLNPIAENYNKEKCHKALNKLAKILEIKHNTPNKLLINELLGKTKINFNKEKRFFQEIKPNQDNYLIYRNNTFIKNATFLKCELQIEQFKKDYPSKITKHLEDKDLKEELTYTSILMTSSLILKELVKNKTEDYYIVDLETSILNSNQKINTLKRMVKSYYTKKYIYFLVSYDSYIEHKNKIINLKNNGYNFIIDCTNKNLINLNLENYDIIYVNNEDIISQREIMQKYYDNNIEIVIKSLKNNDFDIELPKRIIEEL